MPILEAFVSFPAESAIVGRLLAGYAELELHTLNSVTVVRDELDVPLKAMFRSRGETARLNVADALGRQEYTALGLESEFSMAIGAVRYCLKIRNEFAHCQWYDDNSGKMAYVNLEQLSETNSLVTDLHGLDVRHVDVPLLEKQEAYYTYARQLLRWTNFEGRLRAGKLASHPFSKPPSTKPPPLHLP